MTSLAPPKATPRIRARRFLIALLLRGQPLRGRKQPRPQPAADPDAAARQKPIAA
jgi:hypothetical protein